MQILNISINNFRNYSTGKYSFDERTFITGPNASGKSSMLEAIYYFTGFKSFRSSGDRQLIRHGHDSFILNLKGKADDSEFSMGVSAGIEGKTVSLNTEKVKRLTDAFGIFLAVIFSGNDKTLVDSMPYFRRKYIDRIISTIDREYFNSLIEYNRILRQRNALLKQGCSRKMLDTYTYRLSEASSYIYSARQEFLTYFADILSETYAGLSGNGAISVDYFSSKDRGEYTEAGLSEYLAGMYGFEISRKRTVAGPHLDDYRIYVSSRELTKTGSEGERRMLAIAMRFVECSMITENTGNPPVILADDIFAEMDSGKKDNIMSLLDQFNQVIITSPNPAENFRGYKTISLP